MSSISDRITRAKYEHLLADYKKLQQQLERERDKREQAERELNRVLNWTEKIVEPVVGRLADDVAAVRAAVERNSSTMSEQFDQLQAQVGNVETALGNLGTNLAAEIEQVRLEIERLNNANPSIDLSPAIQRLASVEQHANQLGEQVKSIIADAEPTPEPGPAPEPGRGRR